MKTQEAAINEALSHIEETYLRDGTRLVADEISAHQISVRIDMSETDCADCVVDSATMESILEMQLEEVASGANIRVIDPRNDA